MNINWITYFRIRILYVFFFFFMRSGRIYYNKTYLCDINVVSVIPRDYVVQNDRLIEIPGLAFHNVLWQKFFFFFKYTLFIYKPWLLTDLFKHRLCREVIMFFHSPFFFFGMYMDIGGPVIRGNPWVLPFGNHPHRTKPYKVMHQRLLFLYLSVTLSHSFSHAMFNTVLSNSPFPA